VATALDWRREVVRRRGAGCPPADAGAFLSAAVNCSGAGRQTPLHVAAEEGDPPLLRALLGLGAAPDARDRGGATPLFLACEAGRARGVECLLGAGASLTLKNGAGEAPL
jgi:cytohesin